MIRYNHFFRLYGIGLGLSICSTSCSRLTEYEMYSATSSNRPSRESCISRIVNSLPNSRVSKLFSLIQKVGRQGQMLVDDHEQLKSIFKNPLEKINLERLIDGRVHTPLTLAIHYNLSDVVHCLITHGAEVSTLVSGETPLIYAVKTENLAIVQLLGDRVTDLSQRDQEGQTALRHAFAIEEPKPRLSGEAITSPMLTYLIDKLTQENQIFYNLAPLDEDFMTREMGNGSDEDIKMVDWLLEKSQVLDLYKIPEDANRLLKKALLISGKQKKFELLTRLLNHEKLSFNAIKSNGKCDFCLPFAVSQYLHCLLEMTMKEEYASLFPLLKCKVQNLNKIMEEMDADGKYTMLRAAIVSGNKQAVDFFTRSVRFQNNSVILKHIYDAINNKQSDIALGLIEYGSKIFKSSDEGMFPYHDRDAYGYTSLIKAILTDQKTVAEKIIAYSGDAYINVLDSSKLTALSHAAIHQDVELVKLLIGKGASLNIQNTCQTTPLMQILDRIKKKEDQITILAYIHSLYQEGHLVLCDHANRYGHTALSMSRFPEVVGILWDLGFRNFDPRVLFDMSERVNMIQETIQKKQGK